MSGASRKQHDIPCLKLQPFTRRAAQRHRHVAAPDAEHFVGGAVIVMIRENAVSPGSLPAVVAKALLDHASTVMTLHGDAVSPQHHRQPAIGESTVVIEKQKLGCGGHDWPLDVAAAGRRFARGCFDSGLRPSLSMTAWLGHHAET